jgi:phosphoribosylglycinamide formyltransferase-1
MTCRLVVLASGTGSNLQAVLDACTDGTISGEVVLVVSDRPAAPALERTRSAGRTATALPATSNEARSSYDARLADLVAASRPDWVVLAGWMRLLTSVFLERFPGRVLNLHPARPGELPGLRAIERAFDEARAGRRTSTGVMIHLVPDEGVDDGPPLAVVDVPIHVDDTLGDLTARVHAAEHRLLVDVLARLCGAPPATLAHSSSTESRQEHRT